MRILSARQARSKRLKLDQNPDDQSTGAGAAPSFPVRLPSDSPPGAGVAAAEGTPAPCPPVITPAGLRVPAWRYAQVSTGSAGHRARRGTHPAGAVRLKKQHLSSSRARLTSKRRHPIPIEGTAAPLHERRSRGGPSPQRHRSHPQLLLRDSRVVITLDEDELEPKVPSFPLSGWAFLEPNHLDTSLQETCHVPSPRPRRQDTRITRPDAPSTWTGEQSPSSRPPGPPPCEPTPPASGAVRTLAPVPNSASSASPPTGRALAESVYPPATSCAAPPVRRPRGIITSCPISVPRYRNDGLARCKLELMARNGNDCGLDSR